MSAALKILLVCLTFVMSTKAQATELGRLFFTQEQRAQLEHEQQQNDNTPDNVHSLTINGIVQKQDGARTAWVNGVPQLAGKSDELTPESLPVVIPGLAKPVKVKVGQKIHFNPTSSE